MTDHSSAPDTAAALAGAPMAARTGGAARSAVLQYLARSLGLVAAVLGTALVARRLGQAYADWATVLLCAAMVGALLEPGLAPIIVRRLAVAPESAPTPRAMLRVRVGLGLAACVLVVVTSVVSRGADLLLLSLCMGAHVLARSVANNATAWLQVDQRLFRMAFWEALVALVGLLLLAGGLAMDASVPVLGALTFTVPAVVLLVASRHELRLTPSARFGSRGPQAARVRAVVAEALPLGIAITLAAVYTRTSTFFVNRYETDSVASQFFFAFLFAEQSLVVAGITAGAALPLLAARGRSAELLSDSLTQRFLVAMTALGAVGTAGLLGLALPLTELIGGAGMVGAERYVRLIAPMSAVVMPAMALAYVYISMGRARNYLRYGLVGLACNLLLNALLVPAYGALASARITWVTELFITLLALLAVTRSGPAGGRTLLKILLIWGAAVCLSELAATGAVTPWQAATALLAVSVAAARNPLLWLLQEAARRG